MLCLLDPLLQRAAVVGEHAFTAGIGDPEPVLIAQLVPVWHLNDEGVTVGQRLVQCLGAFVEVRFALV